MAYTDDLSDAFFTEAKRFCADLQCKPQHMLKVWFSESKGLHAEAYHENSLTKKKEAYGINQATKESLKSYGWTGDLDDYLKLSAEQQLPYIEKQYSTGYRGKLTSAGRIYLVNFLPSRFFSLGPDGVIARRGDPAFATNTWLDYDNDGAITLQDLEDLADAAVNNTVKDPYGTGWSLKDRWKEIVSRL